MGQVRTSLIVDLTGNLQQQARRFTGGLEQMGQRGNRAMSGLRRGVGKVGQGLDSLGNRYTAMLTGMGASYVTTQAIMGSARLDKELIRTSQTARETAEAAKHLRHELHKMAKQTGQPVEKLLGGFNALIQSDLPWEAALATIQAINPAMAVTGSQAAILASGMTVAAETFDFDLTNVEKSKELLDQMTVAGRLGNAELEDLSSIFARVGANARNANLSFPETLGFIEQLSKIEKQPERLATLADSTLRLFTNKTYMDKAAATTGVSFYDNKGARRQALDVLHDIAERYKTFTTDLDRDNALAAAFQGADMDTIRGLRILLGGDALTKVRGLTDEIKNASGTIAKDLPDAINNSVDQVARLKAALGGAADEFAKPINDMISRATKYLMDEKGLSGGQMLAGGVLGAAGLFGLVKGGGKLLSSIGGTAGGVAVGKALEGATGVQPVFVVNMPGVGMGAGMTAGASGAAGVAAGAAGGTMLSRMATIGKFGLWGAAAAPAAIAGFGLGTTLNENIIGPVMGLLTGGKNKGSGAIGDWLYDALHKESEPERSTLDVNLTVDSEGKARVTNVTSSKDNATINIDNGLTMQGAGL